MNKVVKDADTLRSEIRDNSVRVIDVRREAEYKQDHIPTAANLPLATLLSDDSPERVVKLFQSMGIDDETGVVVYDDTFGALASRVAWTLEYLGHSDVRLLETTYEQWKSMGLESDNVVPDIRAKNHSVNLRPEILATANYLDEVRGREDTVLIDNRERLNYLEQHIPGAVNIPYRTLATHDSILRPRDDLLRLLGNRGVSGDTNIVTYCGSVGTLSGLAYYALKSAGLGNVRLYVRSFKEWKGLNMPTERQPDANYWDLSAE